MNYTVLYLVLMVVFSLVLTFVALLITAKLGNQPKSEYIQGCTRPAPHICAVNGPCNGWPRSEFFQDWLKAWEEESKAEKSKRRTL
jgi:hypothetical protein